MKTIVWTTMAVAGMAGYCLAALPTGPFIGGPDFDTTDAITATCNAAATGVNGPEHSIDGSGLDETGTFHATGHWSAGISAICEEEDRGGKSGATDTGWGWIKWEFDQVYELGSFWVWNYNATEDEAGRAWKDYLLEYSTDGVGWELLQTGTLPQSTGTEDYEGAMAADFRGLSAKFVVLTATGDRDWGDTRSLGISEVRFYLPGGPCDPGDADGDGDVDDDDLSLLLANWGSETAGCGQGEFSDAPPVNDDDLSLLLANWTGSPPAAVPEPTAMAILAAGTLILARRSR